LPLPATAPPPPPAPVDAEATLAGARLLLVEDNPVNMLIAAAMLERWGLEVVQASDGREALDAARRAAAEGRPFDIALMDVQMPVMSGHEATRALRAEGHRLPIVALTAAALVSEREAALAAGMDDFLTKPIDAHKLRATLLRWRGRTSAAPDAG
jgi:CheY-like chemotaxis protein